MTERALNVSSLTHDFGTVRALDDVTVELPVGAVYGLLGPNGAGKTTMIRILLGLIDPTAGEAEVLGHDVRTAGQHIREVSGALMEHSGLYDRLTAADNLDFYGRVWRLPRAERQARTRELLVPFGLYDRRHERVGTWSRGMRQKLDLARALFHRPRLLFLDEPSTGLDPSAAAALREDLARLAGSEGVTVLLTTHNLAEAERLCSVISIIRSGRLLRTGSPGELRAATGQLRVVIRGSGLNQQLQPLLDRFGRLEVERSTTPGAFVLSTSRESDVSPLIAAIIDAGGQVEEVQREIPTLEEAYLESIAEG